MKPALKLLLIFFFAGFLHFNLLAQNPFRLPDFPTGHQTPRRIILLERIDRPALVKISEKMVLHGMLAKDSIRHSLSVQVKRIKGDSLYLNNAGLRFHDLESVGFSNFINYKRADSLNWRVFFPADSIYRDYRSYSSYIHEVTRQFKSEKCSRFSCQSFHNIIKMNLTKIVNAEIAFDYERRISDRWTFEVEAGYQFDSDSSNSEDFLNLLPMYKYSGINIVAGPKFFLGKITYVQLVGIYHYLEMTFAKSTVAMPGGKYGKQSQYRNDLGVALRIGIMTKSFGSMVIDSYAGIGLKFCMINQLLYGTYLEDSSNLHWRNEDHSPDQYFVTLIKPVISLGIKIGVGF